MTKGEIKKLEEINLNHCDGINLSKIPNGRSKFKVKIGRKYVYILEVEKNAIDVTIERYDFKNANYSKYDEESNSFRVTFHNDENFYKISALLIKKIDVISNAVDLFEEEVALYKSLNVVVRRDF